MEQTKTLGETRVRVEFNPNGDANVSQIKEKSARLIDLLEGIRNDELAKTYDLGLETLTQQSGDKLRLIDIAMNKIEEACMWAVKSIT